MTSLQVLSEFLPRPLVSRTLRALNVCHFVVAKRNKVQNIKKSKNGHQPPLNLVFALVQRDLGISSLPLGDSRLADFGGDESEETVYGVEKHTMTFSKQQIG